MTSTSLFAPKLLAGKHILITGGGTGLGKSMAEQFLSLGADVSICGRRKGLCEETAKELMAVYGGTVTPYGVDIRNAQAVDDMIGEIFAQKPLTGLVNNAAGNFISPTEMLSTRGFDAVANIVMHGTFYVTHAVGKRWIEQGWKLGDPMRPVISIIVSWVLNGSPFVVPSAMSKSAIHTMTMSLATEWARYGIRLNAIGPGEIPTEGMSKRLNPNEEPGTRSKKRNPMGRTGTFAELQNLATFLMADGCDWLTGQSIMMDGGGYLANGGNFYELRDWTAEQWKAARDAIDAQNKKDRAERST